MQGREEQVLVTVKPTQHNLHPTFHTTAPTVTFLFPEVLLCQKITKFIPVSS